MASSQRCRRFWKQANRGVVCARFIENRDSGRALVSQHPPCYLPCLNRRPFAPKRFRNFSAADTRTADARTLVPSDKSRLSRCNGPERNRLVAHRCDNQRSANHNKQPRKRQRLSPQPWRFGAEHAEGLVDFVPAPIQWEGLSRVC